jgi:hypothetical protein
MIESSRLQKDCSAHAIEFETTPEHVSYVILPIRNSEKKRKFLLQESSAKHPEFLVERYSRMAEFCVDDRSCPYETGDMGPFVIENSTCNTGVRYYDAFSTISASKITVRLSLKGRFAMCRDGNVLHALFDSKSFVAFDSNPKFDRKLDIIEYFVVLNPDDFEGN